MANAVSFLHGRRTCKNAPWLNIGLAGHGSAKLGEVFQIAKLVLRKNWEDIITLLIINP